MIGMAEMKIMQDKVAQKKESQATFRVIYNHHIVPSKLIIFNYLVHNVINSMLLLFLGSRPIILCQSLLPDG